MIEQKEEELYGPEGRIVEEHDFVDYEEIEEEEKVDEDRIILQSNTNEQVYVSMRKNVYVIILLQQIVIINLLLI